nr:hypothetical protein [Thiocapsa sp. KS1]
MFQYATGYALARRTGSDLRLDKVSGFARDRAYQRRYGLDGFSMEGDAATTVERFPFLASRLFSRLARQPKALISSLGRGVIVTEQVPMSHSEGKKTGFHPELLGNELGRSVFLDGAWQTERYFKDSAEEVAKVFRTPPPGSRRYLDAAKEMSNGNSIAVCVRMYEEAANGAGFWAAPLEVYTKAAIEASSELRDARFFVFSTTKRLLDGKLLLPGKIEYITGDEGYDDTLGVFWLMQQCTTLVVGNSSFYWWAAWLAEQSNPKVKIIAVDNFAHEDAIPDRWVKFPIE